MQSTILFCWLCSLPSSLSLSLSLSLPTQNVKPIWIYIKPVILSSSMDKLFRLVNSLFPPHNHHPHSTRLRNISNNTRNAHHHANIHHKGLIRKRHNIFHIPRKLLIRTPIPRCDWLNCLLSHSSQITADGDWGGVAFAGCCGCSEGLFEKDVEEKAGLVTFNSKTEILHPIYI